MKTYIGSHEAADRFSPGIQVLVIPRLIHVGSCCRMEPFINLLRRAIRGRFGADNTELFLKSFTG